MPLRQLHPDPAAETTKQIDTAKVDIIAVHGLNPLNKAEADHAWDTWRTPSGEKGRLWLLVYGKDQGTFIDKANDLLEAIRTKRKRAESRPILFLGHSMGGLLIKQALINAHNNNNQSHKSIKEAATGLAFFATPHSGGNGILIGFGNVPARIAEFLGYKKHNVLETLKKGSIFSDGMHEQWRHQLEKYSIISFWGSKDTVVSRDSSRFNLPGDRENIVMLIADHSTVCKFGPSQPDQDNLERVLSNIVDIYEAALKKYAYLEDLREASPLQKMDKELQRFYNDKRRLHIERLSGDLLPMNTCYINLAIVEEEVKENGSSKKVEFNLPDIFEERAGRQVPSRVLIRGRAGIGKTTLCKKIVYDFLKGRLWNDLFERIFWLPLRELKTNGMVKDIEDLFREEYLFDIPGKQVLAHDVWAALQSSEYRRTLFLLDGLDEVSEELNGGHKLLEYLVGLPNIIVTSRPHASLPMRLSREFHLELETIGFYPHQVEDYVIRYFPGTQLADQNKCTQILSYLEKHRLIQSLMRIPILLDALCWKWDDFEEQAIHPQTMTAIYAAIEAKLWEKDNEKLERPKYLVASPEYHKLSGEVPHILERLAFAGMCSNLVNFSPTHRKHILEPKDRDEITNRAAPTKTFDHVLSKLSFLRSSDLSSRAHSRLEKRHYHFLHLTFQEYFAARYFVRHWKANKNLGFLDLTTGMEVSIPTEKFLERNKYNARYNIVWRFVAGLLDLDKKPKETERFFRALDGKPLDLLGPVHQRLLMHCLNEAQSESFSLRSKLEGHLSTWLVFQCKSIRDLNRNFSKEAITLLSEIEFPEKALAGVLQENDEVKMIAVSSMKQRRQIPSQIMKIATSLLQNAQISNELTKSILGLLGRSKDKLTEETLYSMVLHLENKDHDVRQSAGYALGPHVLSNKLISTIAARLEHLDHRGRGVACRVLGGQLISKEKLKDFVASLENHDKNVREAASDAARFQLDLPTEVIESIAAKINNQHNSVKWASINALRGQSNLPENLARSLAALVNLRLTRVPAACLKVLSQISNCPDDLLTGIVVGIRDGDKWPQSVDFKAWCHKSKLSEEALRVLVMHLGSQNKQMRCAVIEAMAGQSDLSDLILELIVEQLEVDSTQVRTAAISALCRQAFLAKGTVHEIGAKLEKNKLTRKAALKILEHQSNLPKGVLVKIVDCIEDEDSLIRTAAINAVSSQSYLSDLPEIIDKIMTKIEDSDAEVAEAAMQAVSVIYPSLSEKHRLAIVARVDYHNKRVKLAAFQVLSQQSNLSDDILDLLVARMNDPDEQVRWGAVRALDYQSTLPEGILHKIASQINDPKSMGIGAVDWLIDMLVQREGFHSDFLLLLRAQRVLPPLLVRSFKKQLAWYVQNGESYLETANSTGTVRLSNGVDIEVEMGLARERAGVPPVAALSS
ncbi:hypothetical protein N7520_002492 [Penicillium odoratum]|uniref:uncharacterized protein n=1 Tax=Penicillium odoratum TaxID=1167516 RepID=UPI00254732F4|nr:uncharacterized protein N7520_002492 [Penicillium odoratum]KAJ5771963.1 hypothetical protein N7520_002492 [Penicillium odoratum]